MERKIIIAGAGPAGLTAARELQAAGLKNVTIVEMDSYVGGISRTVQHNGNRIDIGGHRFFSKSEWVMNWWQSYLPVHHEENSKDRVFKYQGKVIDGAAIKPQLTENHEAVMLIRNRLSRIYFNKQFFDYPLKLNFESLRKLGFLKTLTFGFSYIGARISPRYPEKSLEDFLINRFGAKLYRQFFKEYTEKVWGVPCNEISSEWGAQRIKSLSIIKAVKHALKSALGLQKETSEQTSLIESFIYPKYGPGQMWETVAEHFRHEGGTLLMQAEIVGIDISEGKVKSVTVKDRKSGCEEILECTHFISSMPIKNLFEVSKNAWPSELRKIAAGLQYRDFFTVGLLYEKRALKSDLKDNWIYIQEPGVNVGRIQIFNNWSPYMVAQPNAVWLGLEFFCKEEDPIWQKTDAELIRLAEMEIKKIALVSHEHALDAVVLKVPKAYPGYFGKAYEDFPKIRIALDSIENLFLIGRNGMHRYNNQDHSMLTAKEAASQIVENRFEKDKIWAINIDDEYHEEKK